MNSRINVFSLLVLSVGLTACGPREYSPEPGTSATDMFAAGCQSCHGEGGKGKFGFLLKVAGTDATEADISAHIRDGGFLMPAFPNIGEQERQSLAAYLKGQ